MAAREIMEKDNVLQLRKAEQMINPGLAPSHRLWTDVIDKFVALDRKRLTAVRPRDFKSKGAMNNAQRKAAIFALRSRISLIIQRRHDIVHNCDRPKVSPLRINPSDAAAMVADISDFVSILDDHIQVNRLA